MPSSSSSCPRCGYQEMRDILFWQNENHICAHCGAYWKTVNSVSDDFLVDQTIPNEKSKSKARFGKKASPKTKLNNQIDSYNGQRPSAITGDFFEKDYDYKTVPKSKNRSDASFRSRSFLPEFSFVNIATFSVAALTLVSLPQIGLFSVAGQAIQEQVAALDFSAETTPQIDTIVTASTSKKAVIQNDLRVGELKFSRVERGTQSFIVVDGMIRNISGDDTTSRPLLIVLLDKNGNEVQSWFYKVKSVSLEPGKILRFRSAVKAVAYGAKSVRVVISNR